MASPQPSIVFGLYGAGGFAREVMPLLQASAALKKAALYFIETNPTVTTVNGIKVMAEKDFFALKSKKKYFNVAIANAKARQEISGRCSKNGCTPFAIQANNATWYDPRKIGEGAIMCAYTTMMPNITIGKFFHANIYSYVAHDCVIGDYVTFAPNVKCNGNVHIGNHAYIGTGAIIRPGASGKPLIIGEGAVVGMGAIVTKNVAPFTTVVGNPARLLKKKS